MKTVNFKLLLLMPLIVFSSCKGQANKGEQQLSASINTQSHIDTSSMPRYKVNVNKQYDDSGHLIKYDSSYSYSYSSPGGMQHIKDDTVYKRFREYFEKNYSNIFNPPVQQMFYQDSLFKYDFFNNDFFIKRFEVNNEIFNKMYRQMDSLKAEFLNKNYPNGQQKRNSQLKS
jgi:hypothetical protein